MAVDALGNPLRCLLSAGQLSDVTHAQALIEGFKTDAVLGDKAYDANALLEYLAQHNIQAVIPPPAFSNRGGAAGCRPMTALPGGPSAHPARL